LFLPLAATLPLLLVYYANGGSTSVLLPFGDRVGAVDIGPLYYAFLAALGIFCTNAINILAGVNGLEVGQSVVIAFSIVVNNCVQLARIPSRKSRRATTSSSHSTSSSRSSGRRAHSLCTIGIQRSASSATRSATSRV
jgi:UDP-N-acetylmuramyl pentapeptide phosphotransferase/UDP-N-acetylglucosamine-1-phosphate transferase